ncbi:MAG: amino acid ABC transporter permease [Deltaproteobacteria bacterium]|nr:amino acid ABC transporter permease [Deltaproteobacteria bacterium]
MVTKYSAKPIKSCFSAKDGIKFLVAAGLIVWFMSVSTGKLDYNWQWYRIPKYLFTFIDGSFVAGPLLDGILVTLKIAAISLAISSIFGLVTALFRLSDSFAARTLSRGYMELIRNTPLLVQIFFIYFVISPVLGFSRFTSAVLALSLFEGAYASEIFRAGILSIHRGQWEAACSIGLNRWNTYRHVILPQAIRHMLPPLASQAISLIKDSALVSTIAIYDLTMQGQQIIAETYMVFELWFIIAAIYLLMTATLSIVVNIMETHFAVEA